MFTPTTANATETSANETSLGTMIETIETRLVGHKGCLALIFFVCILMMYIGFTTDAMEAEDNHVPPYRKDEEDEEALIHANTSQIKQEPKSLAGMLAKVKIIPAYGQGGDIADQQRFPPSYTTSGNRYYDLADWVEQLSLNPPPPGGYVKHKKALAPSRSRLEQEGFGKVSFKIGRYDQQESEVERGG
ncbi:uncharacterized protein LTR77_006728 [Saxophila tyrrhenica]|uniref:Uncharacterized protein n=1 Tax=Saxophila tyrrhenica TaxID=1690608 RepID=A0AAV9P8K6_9PEZI|nr:hypothetical protein LTR77_006728 [Saxophila tyrrhenica]